MSDTLCNKHSFEINPYPKPVCPWCEIEVLEGVRDAADRIYNRDMHSQSDEDRLREALAAAERGERQ